MAWLAGIGSALGSLGGAATSTGAAAGSAVGTGAAAAGSALGGAGAALGAGVGSLGKAALDPQTSDLLGNSLTNFQQGNYGQGLRNLLQARSSYLQSSPLNNLLSAGMQNMQNRRRSQYDRAQG